MQEGKVHYLIGNDPEKWQTDIPVYGAVLYKNVYDGIDMKFYGNNRRMEYDIMAKPGASPSRVQLLYDGVAGLRITDKGDLEIALNNGSIIHKKPIIYQRINGERREIVGRFKLLNPSSGHGDSKLKKRNTQYLYGFQVASYDKKYPLIIDPVLSYSTYLGGSGGWDWGYGIAVDSSGNAYVTGETSSEDFPTKNAFQGNHQGGSGRFGFGDVFVTKFTAGGNNLSYSTFLGGREDDNGFGIAVDSSGNAYVTGITWSEDFPTQNAFQGNQGSLDAFVTKLTAGGNSLSYSTYLGGSDRDWGKRITVDSSGNAYVTGYTDSEDFPTQNAFQGSFQGGFWDAFVTKLTAGGDSLSYSTYLGGEY